MCSAARGHVAPAQADQAGSSAAGGPPLPLTWHGRSSGDSCSLLQDAAAAGLQQQHYFGGDGGTPLAEIPHAVLCAVPSNPSTVPVHERAALAAAGWLKR